MLLWTVWQDTFAWTAEANGKDFLWVPVFWNSDFEIGKVRSAVNWSQAVLFHEKQNPACGNGVFHRFPPSNIFATISVKTAIYRICAEHEYMPYAVRFCTLAVSEPYVVICFCLVWAVWYFILSEQISSLQFCSLPKLSAHRKTNLLRHRFLPRKLFAVVAVF